MPKNPPPSIPGFGPTCTPELQLIGIHSAEQIRALGWEEAFLRWTARFPNRINVNAAYGMISAEQGIHWQRVSEDDKQRARQLVAQLRKQLRQC